MATMDMWVEGGWGDISIAFQQDIPLDMERFQSDDVYAHRISSYITAALGYLAEELVEIGLMPTPTEPEPTVELPIKSFRCIGPDE